MFTCSKYILQLPCLAELYIEVQTSLQAKMEAETEARSSRGDLAALVKAKEWYQQQLQQANESKGKLQRELTVLQVIGDYLTAVFVTLTVLFIFLGASIVCVNNL